jgi:hypothetical protein
MAQRKIAPEVVAKGQAALAAWRIAKAAATKKGGKALAQWLADEELKKALKRTTPLQAIKNFCIHCVGGAKQDIKNCAAPACPLYIYRPFQKDEV